MEWIAIGYGSLAQTGDGNLRARYTIIKVLMPRAKVWPRGVIRELKLVSVKVGRRAKRAVHHLIHLPLAIQLPIIIFLAIVSLALGFVYYHHQLYTVSPASRQLLTASSINTSEIKVSPKAQTISYSVPATASPKQDINVAGPVDATGKTGYQATINQDFTKGLTFGDNSSDLSFQLTPLFGASAGKYTNGQVFFPVSTNTKLFQTFKKNGIKEDIVLSSKPSSNTQTFQWKLNLGDKLTAKLQTDGSIGIFASNPNLYGNLQASDPKDQALINKAKTTNHNYLLFVIPTPTIKDSTGKTTTVNVKFSLNDNTLTLTATNLDKQTYPISLDPSVTITTTADFTTNYADDGMIDYTTADQIGRNAVGLGTVGATTQQTNAFTTARSDHTSVVYNGYVYIVGGIDGTSTYLNDIQYCQLNGATGVGACTQQTNAFTTARADHSSVVYNGYLYIIGGFDGTSTYNDIQHCPINPTTHAVGACVQQTNAFTTARSLQSSVAYNGYLYVLGGGQNDVQHCPINADGSVGTCVQQTNAFTTARTAQSAVTYNGYLYIIGGCSNTNCLSADDDIIHCPINADGSVGTCIQQTGAISTARGFASSVVYDGYIYISGGFFSSQLNDIYHCPVNADGSVGTCVQQTTAFTTARQSLTSVAYNGYLYLVGGKASVGVQNDIQHLAISTGTPTGLGAVGATTQQTNAFTNARLGHTSVVYNGYLYIIGGENGPYLNDIQYCPINTNGSVGACTQQTSAFTTARGFHTSVVYNGYLYIIGGFNGSPLNDIQYCPINTNGSVGACTQQTSAFTTARYLHTSEAYNGYLYIIGGYDFTINYNDIQHCPINSNGSVGACTQQTSAFTTARDSHTSFVYNGYLYIIGGTGTGGPFSDIQYIPLTVQSNLARYEHQIDLGKAYDSVDSIVYNTTAFGSTYAGCGVNLSYATAGSNGVYNSPTTIYQDAMPGRTYNITANNTNIRYVRIVAILDDQQCGVNSTITDITLNYTNLPPAAPTLSYPGNNQLDVSLTPTFQLKTTDGTSDYTQYKIILYQSDCTTLIRTIDETVSQTGWSGQDAQTGSAYVTSNVLSGSTMASHTYQAPALSYNTQYCWKAAAIDPGGSNTFGSYTASQLFSTNVSPLAPTLVQPANAQTGTSLTPEFRMYTTDQDNDYLKYKIDICTTSNCSIVLTTIDQTTSQAGWTGQSLQTGTAYSSGQTAIYTYQSTVLTANTQYWWRAYAIDPAGTNLFSSASSIGTFTTQTSATSNQAIIRGNVNIGGNVLIKP